MKKNKILKKTFSFFLLFPLLRHFIQQWRKFKKSSLSYLLIFLKKNHFWGGSENLLEWRTCKQIIHFANCLSRENTSQYDKIEFSLRIWFHWDLQKGFNAVSGSKLTNSAYLNSRGSIDVSIDCLSFQRFQEHLGKILKELPKTWLLLLQDNEVIYRFRPESPDHCLKHL